MYTRSNSYLQQRNDFLNNIKRRLIKALNSKTMPKKPKFLSLRLQFQPEETNTSRKLSELHRSATFSAAVTNSHQLNWFPFHPQSQVEDGEIHEHENVAYFFSTADGGATTLTGLLDTTNTTVSTSSNTNESSRPDDLSPSASLTYAYGREDNEKREALMRNALKNRVRDSSEEKWVCYSEVVERKLKEEEVTSSAVDLRRPTGGPAEIQRLSLKLDYEEILNAWSDKGPLYIHADSSQIVPDITDDFLFHEGVSQRRNMGIWAVPEIENDEMRLKIEQREASVLRYKAKRHNRLFSNKIRYQVRKLNAEKRPRIKGRFVKRN